MADDNRKVYTIMDLETGEHIGNIKQGDSINRAETKEYLSNTIKIDNNFIKLFTSNIMPVIGQIKDKKGRINYNALSLMFYLMQFISYKSGLLQHENGKPLTNKFILENFSMCKTDLYYCLKILKDKSIISIVEIKEDNTNYYIFNPWIASSGKRIDKTHLHIFADSIYIKNNEGEE